MNFPVAMSAKRARRDPNDGGGEVEVLFPAAAEWIQPETWIDNRKPVPRKSVKRPVQIKKPVRVKKLSVGSKEKESRPSIFSLATPVLDSAFGGAPPVKFVLDKCHNCWKEIREEKVFMYSSLGFCSIECRQVKIEFDSRMEKLVGKSGGMKIGLDLNLSLALSG